MADNDATGGQQLLNRGRPSGKPIADGRVALLRMRDRIDDDVQVAILFLPGTPNASTATKHREASLFRIPDRKSPPCDGGSQLPDQAGSTLAA